jgi:hypothetical protein
MDEEQQFKSRILGHGFDNRYCHKGPIYCLWEVLYVPDRGFVKVPEYLSHFDGDFPLWTIDQGYVARVYPSWYFWKFIRDRWFQPDGKRWCLCPNAPYALISLLFNFNTDHSYVLEPANGYTESPLDAITIWIPTKSLLRQFFSEWGVSLAYNAQNTYEQCDTLAALLSCVWAFEDASPSDYVHCYWPQMNTRERTAFIDSLPSDDRVWLKNILGIVG